MMLSVAVCGDSWFSTDTNFPGQSFGETICAQNNWKLIDLARAGCSNFAISLQVDRAILLEADLVIVGTTTSDRIEIPLIKETNRSIWDQLSQGFKWDTWFDLQAACYDKNKGLDNLYYQRRGNGIGQSQIEKDPNIISESLNNLLFFENSPITQQQRTALRQYMTYLHDTNTRKQIDAWIISDACARLYRANRKFLLFIEALYQWDYNQDIAWIADANIFRPADLCLWDLPRSHAEFHYTPGPGSMTIAEKLLPKIYNLLS